MGQARMGRKNNDNSCNPRNSWGVGRVLGGIANGDKGLCLLSANNLLQRPIVKLHRKPVVFDLDVRIGFFMDVAQIERHA